MWPQQGAGEEDGGASQRARRSQPSKKVVEREQYQPAPEPVVSAAIVSLHEGITLTDLKPCSCRWPVGDPSTDDFRYCGAQTSPGDTYCAAHAEVAQRLHAVAGCRHGYQRLRACAHDGSC